MIATKSNHCCFEVYLSDDFMTINSLLYQSPLKVFITELKSMLRDHFPTTSFSQKAKSKL